MDINKYTSLELSKKITKGMEKLNIKLESEHWYAGDWKTGDDPELIMNCGSNPKSEVIKYLYPAYDILNDLCVRHCDEFFGDNEVTHGKTSFILYLLQQGKTQDEIEDYIWKQCEFNKKEQQLIKANQ